MSRAMTTISCVVLASSTMFALDTSTGTLRSSFVRNCISQLWTTRDADLPRKVSATSLLESWSTTCSRDLPMSSASSKPRTSVVALFAARMVPAGVDDQQHLAAGADADEDLVVVLLQGAKLGHVPDGQQSLGENRLERARDRSRMTLVACRPGGPARESRSTRPCSSTGYTGEIGPGSSPSRALSDRSRPPPGPPGTASRPTAVPPPDARARPTTVSWRLQERRHLPRRMDPDVPCLLEREDEAFVDAQEALQDTDRRPNSLLGADVPDERFAEDEEKRLDGELPLDLAVVQGNHDGGGGDVGERGEEPEIFGPVQAVGLPAAEAQDADHRLLLDDRDGERRLGPREQRRADCPQVLEPRIDQELLFPQGELPLLEGADEIIGGFQQETRLLLAATRRTCFPPRRSRSPASRTAGTRVRFPRSRRPSARRGSSAPPRRGEIALSG